MAAASLKDQNETAHLPVLPEPGDVVQGRYTIERELGRGGMGVVLAAQDEMLGRTVALKVVIPKMLRSIEIVERFSNEARSLAQLESPNVVRVLDFGTFTEPAACAGLPFMALEFLRGEDLFTTLARDGALSPARVVRYALQACSGLAAAHSRGIIHRDLKPENLFVSIQADGTECLKVLDFGIARSHSRRALTRGHLGVGSPGYMSPEQVEGTGEVDARTDLWGLGVVMYELLSHRPAFFGDNPQSLCLQILTSDVPSLRELRPDLPAALVYIVERCMARDPAQRFANVAELAEALSPLDVWNPESDAERIRRRLEGAADDGAHEVSELRPLPLRRRASNGQVQGAPLPGPSRARRFATLLVACAVLVPIFLLLPAVARAPAMAPARAFTAQAVERTQTAWQKLRQRAHELWM
ncbi:MAG TPA: serine/threonine-protein kinase, partial [Polyangiaceae bacterium]|nr:serine/threonine-protein kinase [Polyangiaceae bacterium]